MFSRHAKRHAVLRARFLQQFHQGGTLYICPHALQKPSQSVCAFGLTSWGFMVNYTHKRKFANPSAPFGLDFLDFHSKATNIMKPTAFPYIAGCRFIWCAMASNFLHRLLKKIIALLKENAGSDDIIAVK